MLADKCHVSIGGNPNRELAWAAGFFDGEGTTYCGRSTKAKKKPWHIDPCFVRVQVSQNDRAPLERFKRAVGCGFINGPYTNKLQTQPHFVWHISSQSGVRDVLWKLWPFLSQPKREQALIALNRLNQYLDEPRGRWAHRKEVMPNARR